MSPLLATKVVMQIVQEMRVSIVAKVGLGVESRRDTILCYGSHGSLYKNYHSLVTKQLNRMTRENRGLYKQELGKNFQR